MFRRDAKIEQKVNVLYQNIYLTKSIFSNRKVMTEKLNWCMLPMKSYISMVCSIVEDLTDSYIV